ncbi:hypothetical protein [Roseovarius aestuarii]|uniref:Lipoprotein n=1 Tax=Roseovarius aestuarii TaxID=475083 RepID=A0A1X7BMY4_9RHOB|nr:hypothetical protein [Roseovarius aestuarii]SMC10904.1 hypothetical protein ROA7745_00712 [Roseovarius aestuarii]
MKQSLPIVVLFAFLVSACAETQNSPAVEEPAAETQSNEAKVAKSGSIASPGSIRTIGSRKVSLSLTRKVDSNHGSPKVVAQKVPCKVEGQGISKSFMSPGMVNLPAYQSDNSVLKEIEFSCTYEGETYNQTLTTINLSGRNRSLSSGVAASLVCGQACSQAAANRAMMPKPGDIYGYTNFQLSIE